ncbi:MAG: hypothetical protein ACUZ8I_16845 [Candidatus Scalindua sp.]
MERLILRNPEWNIDDLIETIKGLTDDYWKYYTDISGKCSKLEFIEKDKIASYSLSTIYLLQAGVWKFPDKQEHIEGLFVDFCDIINRSNPAIRKENRLYYDFNEILTEGEFPYFKKSLGIEPVAAGPEIGTGRRAADNTVNPLEPVGIAVTAEQQISSATEGTMTPELEPTSRQLPTFTHYILPDKKISKFTNLWYRITNNLFLRIVSYKPKYAIVKRELFGNYLTEQRLSQDRRTRKVMNKYRKVHRSACKREKEDIDTNG